MEYAIASESNPLAFFEDYFMQNGFMSHMNEFAEWCKKEYKKHPEHVKVFAFYSDIVIHQNGYN